jgi:hypothetical protein
MAQGVPGRGHPRVRFTKSHETNPIDVFDTTRVPTSLRRGLNRTCSRFINITASPWIPSYRYTLNGSLTAVSFSPITGYWTSSRNHPMALNPCHEASTYCPCTTYATVWVCGQYCPRKYQASRPAVTISSSYFLPLPPPIRNQSIQGHQSGL